MLVETSCPLIELGEIADRIPSASVTLQKYDGDLWCWAACVSMVLVASKSPKKPKTQCAIAKAELGSEACVYPDKILQDFNLAVCVDRIKFIWKYWGVQASRVGKALALEELDAQLCDKRPVEIFLSRNCKDGHLVLIVDLFKDRNSQYIVTIADPISSGCFRWAYFDAIGKALGRGPWCDTWTNLPQVKASHEL